MDDWPEDTLDPDELVPCFVCGSLEQWESWTHQWHCLDCDPPLMARRFWALEKEPPATPARPDVVVPKAQLGLLLGVTW